MPATDSRLASATCTALSSGAKLAAISISSALRRGHSRPAAMSPSTRRSSAFAGACSARRLHQFHAAPGMPANDRGLGAQDFRFQPWVVRPQRALFRLPHARLFQRHDLIDLLKRGGELFLFDQREEASDLRPRSVGSVRSTSS